MSIGKRTVLAAAFAAALAGGAVIAQQQSGPTRGNHDWASKAKAGKHHTLPATLETVQWGWLDPNEKPKLTINSGDTVSIETMMHAHDGIRPGVDMDRIRVQIGDTGQLGYNMLTGGSRSTFSSGMATVEAARCRGYASAVTRRLARDAFDEGASHVCLLADPDDVAVVAMYERLGFAGAGRLAATRGPLPAA